LKTKDQAILTVRNKPSLTDINLLQKEELLKLEGYEIDAEFIEQLFSQIKNQPSAFLTGTGDVGTSPEEEAIE